MGNATTHDSQPIATLSATEAQSKPVYDSRDRHLAVSGLRSVSRSVSERSIDRQSVDSVQLALKLGGSSDIDDADSDRQSSRGLRFIQDELPPFVTNGNGSASLQFSEAPTASAKTTPRSTAGVASDIREIDLTELPDDPLPSDLNSSTSAKVAPIAFPGRSGDATTHLHTPIRQTSSNRNPTQFPPRSDPAISKSSSMTIGARNKPVGTSSVRQRTASAVKASYGTDRWRRRARNPSRQARHPPSADPLEQAMP